MTTQAPLPPRIKALPLIGALPQVMTNFPKLFQETAPEQGDVVRVPLGPMDLYVVSHPDYAQYVLRDNYKNFSRTEPGSISRVLGRGMVMLDGEDWLVERRMMQPYFHRKYFPALIDTMMQTIDEMLDALDQRVDEGVIDFVPFIKRMILLVFLRAMYSTGLDREITASTVKSIDRALSLSSKREWMKYFIPLSITLPMDKQIERDVAYIDQVTSAIIRERKGRSEQPADLLGFLIEASDEASGRRMSEQQLQHESRALIVGAYDTTAGALMWLVQLLRDQPDMVTCLVEEASHTFAEPVTFERVSQLEFCRETLMETLRLRPVAWANGRVCLTDDKLGDYRIPGGSMIVFPVVRYHTDPRWWNEPQTFKPERWREKDGGAAHSWAYIPFGGGPRVCLGQHFALLEATLVVSKLFHRFEVIPVDATLKKINYSFSMQPVEMPVRLKRR